MEMTIAQCLECDRREWLSCLHKAGRTETPEGKENNQEYKNTETEVKQDE